MQKKRSFFLKRKHKKMPTNDKEGEHYNENIISSLVESLIETPLDILS